MKQRREVKTEENEAKREQRRGKEKKIKRKEMKQAGEECTKIKRDSIDVLPQNQIADTPAPPGRFLYGFPI